MMRSILILILFVAAITTAATAQDAPVTVTAPEAGFRLVIPDVGWIHTEQRADDGLTALAVGDPAAAGLIQLTIQVTTVADDSPAATHAQIDQLRGAVAGDASILELDDLELTVAGRAAPGLRVVQSAAGREFMVHLVFLRAHEHQYRIQFHAPRDQFEEQWPIAQRVLAGFELIELDDTALERVRLRRLAARCGSEVAWAADWNEAAERARREGRLIVVSVFAQPGFELGNALNEGVFMSREILALMEHRFVGLRWSAGMSAPFVDHDVFGLSGTTFGVGLLVCTPAGDVVRQVFMPKPILVADALRETLREHADLAPAPAMATGGQTEQVAFLIDSGQLDTARRVLGRERADEPAATTFQRALLHRIARDGKAALRALDAVARGGDAIPDSTRLLEEAAVHIGMRNDNEAEAALLHAFTLATDPAEQAYAGLLLGAIAWASGDVETTRMRWLEVTREFPDEPAAWVAAAGVLGPALEVKLRPDIGWPSEVASRLSTLPAPATDPTLEIEPGLILALGWLIDTQRDDGRWDVPFAAGDQHPAPHAIAMASQAICTLALTRAARVWETRDPEDAGRCLDAAHTGLARYLDDHELTRLHPRPVAFMDYTCWSSSYGLFCLTTILDENAGIANTLDSGTLHATRRCGEDLVDDLVRIQAANGGWSYYISGAVDGTSAGAAMSFTTATVLLALQSARDIGFEVPDSTLDRGYDCLAAMRGTNGVFEYMVVGPGPHRAGEVAAPGAAARGPVCTLALQRGGRLDAAAMGPAVEIFVEHLGSFGAESRKALMHAGPAGQGSHYLLYDYSTAAESIRCTDGSSLDADGRRRARVAILEQLARCRSADGSFVDNPLIGSAPGTGLATLTLIDLLTDPIR